MLDVAQPQGAAARECINGSDEEEMTDWQPIETAPKDGTEILVFNGNSIWLVETEYEMYPKDNGCGCCSHSIHDEVTHWMPLPEPPK